MSFFLCLVLQSSATENGQYDYTRSGNPTRDALERYFFLFVGVYNADEAVFTSIRRIALVISPCIFFLLSLFLFYSFFLASWRS